MKEEEKVGMEEVVKERVGMPADGIEGSRAELEDVERGGVGRVSSGAENVKKREERGGLTSDLSESLV